MNDFLLLGLITVGALVSGLTGLGGGTLILAGLLLFFPPQLALALHSFTQLSSNSLRCAFFFRQIKWKVVFGYAVLMIPGAWLAGELSNLVNPNWLKIIVGSFIFISLIPLPFTPKGEPRLQTFMVLGAISGFLGVFIGSVGPMVTPFFNRLKLSRQGMLSTKSAGQAFLQLSKIIAFWGAVHIEFAPLKDQVLLLVLGTLLGVGLSIPVSQKISDQKFTRLVNLILALIALKVMTEGVDALMK